MSEPKPPIRIIVLISGSGSNLQAIIKAIQQNKLAAKIVAVISNRPTAKGLQHAAAAGIPHQTIDHRQFANRAAFDQALADNIQHYAADLIVLAGFMRILTPAFVEQFTGQLLNIHPSLLPAFPGLHTHQRALESGTTEHGASVHFVTSELDGGPVVLQAVVPVLTDDTADQLAARVLAKEHRCYPTVIQWFATGRLRMNTQQQPIFDGHIMLKPIRI
jgi:phosphoribosylglycinamide formyltransferase-1